LAATRSDRPAVEPAVDTLLAVLAGDDTNAIQEAIYSLAELGEPAISPVLSVIGELGVFPQRCALDLIERWPLEQTRAAVRPSVTDVLIPLLESQDAVVRQRAADGLNRIGGHEAVPALEAALARSKANSTPPDWTEPVSLRAALTALGARRVVRPPLLASSAVQTDFQEMWPAPLLPTLIDALAAANQVLLYFQAWLPDSKGLYWSKSPVYELDLDGDWLELVTRARAQALEAARTWTVPSDSALVSLEWIGEGDR
jgi:hypothetical protein